MVEWRDREGLTNMEAAARFPVSPSSFGHWCSGLWKPSAKFKDRAVELANIELAWWDEPPKKRERRVAA